MKILVIGLGHTKYDDRKGRVRSGGETKLIMILKEWLKINGENIFMLCSNLSKHLYEEDGLKMNYLTLPSRYDSSHFGIGATYLKRIFGVYKMDIKERFDVIFSASDIFFDIIPSVIMKMRNRQAKLISCLYLIAPLPFKGYRSTFNDGISIPNLRSIGFYLSQKLSIFLLRRYAESIWVLNHMDKQSLGNMNISLDKIEVVSGGIDLDFFSKIRSKRHLHYDAAFLGRFHPQKGLFDAVKIWRYVCDEKGEARLAIIGGGNDLWISRVRDEIKKHRIEANVDLYCFLKREEIFSILKSSKLFIFPSTYESWGIAACEAMACGLPVIAYDLPVYKDIFLKGMKTTPLHQVREFAKVVVELLDNNIEYNNFAREALEMAMKYDWKVIAQKEYHLLRQINKR